MSLTVYENATVPTSRSRPQRLYSQFELPILVQSFESLCIRTVIWAYHNFLICLREITIKAVEKKYFQRILNHMTPIFMRDEPLSSCFPSCTTGKRESDFRKYAEIQLWSGFSVMALDGTQVVGASLNKLITKDEVFDYYLSSDDDPSKWSFLLYSLLFCVHFY